MVQDQDQDQDQGQGQDQGQDQGSQIVEGKNVLGISRITNNKKIGTIKIN